MGGNKKSDSDKGLAVFVPLVIARRRRYVGQGTNFFLVLTICTSFLQQSVLHHDHGIGAKREKGGNGWEVGSFDGPPEAADLVLRPPSQGGRDWVTKAVHDKTLHAVALAAMRGGRK